MKKLLLVLAAAGISISAAAQKVTGECSVPPVPKWAENAVFHLQGKVVNF